MTQELQQPLVPEDEVWSLGIDPGWKNLGATLVRADGDKVKIELAVHGNPSATSSPEEFCEDLIRTINITLPPSGTLRHSCIERYVAYNNVMSSETENITQVIGMIRQSLYNWFQRTSGEKPLDVRLYRAIEWKTQLVKLLAKHYGFSNPSKKMELDKEFSIAAAKFVSTNPEVITNDHIADAVCLAALPILEKRCKIIPRLVVKQAT